MNVKTDWFRARLAEREISLRQLARDMDLDPSAVSLMLRGKRRMTLAEAKKIADLLVLPATEVIRAAGVTIQDDMVSVPVKLHFDAAGVGMSARTEKRIQAPFDTPKDAYAAQIRQQTSVFNGWVMVVSPVRNDPAKCIERLVVATLGNGAQRLGVLRRGYEQENYTIMPLQDEGTALDDVRVKYAQYVIWIKP